MSSNTRVYLFALLCATVFLPLTIEVIHRIGIYHDFGFWDYIVVFAIPLWIIVRLLSELAITLADCDIVDNDDQ